MSHWGSQPYKQKNYSFVSFYNLSNFSAWHKGGDLKKKIDKVGHRGEWSGVEWKVGGGRGRPPPHPPPHPRPFPPLIFAITCLFFFCTQFEETQIALFEVALIINNAPLTYVNPNTIETCLTHNHLLFCRQWLFSSNTTLTVIRNPTVLSSTIDKINRISNHYLDRWKHEYVINLRETQ